MEFNWLGVAFVSENLPCGIEEIIRILKSVWINDFIQKRKVKMVKL